MTQDAETLQRRLTLALEHVAELRGKLEALQTEYHESDPFPPAAREAIETVLVKLKKSQNLSLYQEQEVEFALIKLRNLPARRNQALWESMGGTGPAPDHFRPGYDALWNEFERGESWLTWPRALMHLMPDEWQGTMARMKSQYQATWTGSKLPRNQQFDTTVRAKRDGKLVPLPAELSQYRHINREAMEKYR